MSNSSYFVVSREQHGDLVQAAYMHRGYREDESASAARMCFEASVFLKITCDTLAKISRDLHQQFPVIARYFLKLSPGFFRCKADYVAFSH